MWIATEYAHDVEQFLYHIAQGGRFCSGQAGLDRTTFLIVSALSNIA